MKCAALQWDVQRGALEANLEAAEAALGAARAAGARLVVLPELWTTSFPGAETELDAKLLEAADRGREWAQAVSAEHGMVVAGSYLASSPAELAGRFFNRLVVFDQGAQLFEYDKLHLFQPTAEHEVFTAGSSAPPVVDSSVGRLSGVICYDLRFGELFTHVLEAGAEVVVCPAQWPTARESHWRALVMGRAVETQATFVAANRLGGEAVGRAERWLEFPGNSLVVDGHGVVSAEGVGQSGAVLGKLDLTAARSLRVRVPVGKGRRPDVYREWRP